MAKKNAGATITVVTLETRNFQFEAAGLDLNRAIEALKAGWAVHRKQTGAMPLKVVTKETVGRSSFIRSDRRVRRVRSTTCA